MSFLTPTSLLLGLLAGPIVLLYMLRLRRRERPVSSTMLWQRLLRDREANAPWQRLRRNLLLLLQLLILAALVLALARPFLPVPSLVTGNVVVLLDASASMLATDVAPADGRNRFEAAKSEVFRLINELGGNDRMTIIKVGRTATVLTSSGSDKTSLRQAVEAAAADPAAADWRSALALAAGAAQGFREARVFLVSDGGLPTDLPFLSAETVYLPIGESGENLAISGLATRQTPSGPQLFASVANHGFEDHGTLISILLDGMLFDSRRLTVPAGSTTNLTWDLLPETTLIEAQLSESDDFLAVDDRAWAVHEGGVDNRALLITSGNIFLEQALAVLPGIELFKIDPGRELPAIESQPFDLYVFDSAMLPDPLPDGDLLILNPLPGEVGNGGDGRSPSARSFTVTGTFSDTVAIRLADSPLLQYVEWGSVHIREARHVVAPWAQPLVTAEGGPLILAGEGNGRRMVILTFDLHDSDLPLQIAFPVLMANITSWLSPGRAFDIPPAGLRPGTPIAISPGVTADAVSVIKPDGTVWVRDVGDEEMIFAEADQLGIYQVRLRETSSERPAGSFAVNLFEPSESGIQPSSTVTIGRSPVQGSDDGGDIGQRELWPWLIAAAFVVLLFEWWVYFRGTRLGRIEL